METNGPPRIHEAGLFFGAIPHFRRFYGITSQQALVPFQSCFGAASSAVALVVVMVVIAISLLGGNASQPEDDAPGIPDDLLLVQDLYEGERYIPKFDFPTNQYDTSLFVEDNGFIRYNDGKSVQGVGRFRTPGSDRLAAGEGRGIDFAFLRLGYRGMTEGGLNVDATFEENYQGATAAGLKVGVYFFSQAITQKEAKEEAQFVLDTLNGRELTSRWCSTGSPHPQREPSSGGPAGLRHGGGSDHRHGGTFCPGHPKGRPMTPACTPIKAWPTTPFIWGSLRTTPCGMPNTSPHPACITISAFGSIPPAARCRASPPRWI